MSQRGSFKKVERRAAAPRLVDGVRRPFGARWSLDPPAWRLLELKADGREETASLIANGFACNLTYRTQTTGAEATYLPFSAALPLRKCVNTRVHLGCLVTRAESL